MERSRMGACEVAQAQARELIRALRDRLREMTAKVALLERQDVALRLEAAALRRDIAEAHALIDRLQSRYLSSDERTQHRRRRPA
jgi:hypothetical protein